MKSSLGNSLEELETGCPLKTSQWKEMHQGKDVFVWHIFPLKIELWYYTFP